MAQTHRLPHEVETSGETERDSDAAAWLRACTARKFASIDGVPINHSGGAIFFIPAPKGFAGLDPKVQLLVATALVQYVSTRVAQMTEGESMNASVAKAMRGEDIPGANDSDAREAVYQARVAELIEAKQGALDKNASAEEKAARRASVQATADAFRERLYDKVVNEAIARGSETIAAKERKRAAKKSAAPVVEISL